jgi:hypothetical protein
MDRAGRTFSHGEMKMMTSRPATSAKLRDLALTLLKKHDTPEAALPNFAKALTADTELRRALELQYLRSVAPPPATSRRRSGKHRRPAAKLPSAKQKAANIAVAKDYAHEIFKRKLRGGKMLGQIRVNELRAFAQASAQVATQFLNRGYEDAVDLFACIRLANHCQTSDPDVLVKDAIKPAVVVAIYDRARIDAAEEIATRGATLTQELISAAATRGEQQIEYRP